MDKRLLAIAIEGETDIIQARQRTRAIAEGMGFDRQDQTRITTAISEVVRNALEYAGGGRVEYRVIGPSSRELEIVVTDTGPGIADIAAILEGRYQSANGMGVGLIGARRLMDGFHINSAKGKGTTVTLRKRLGDKAKPVTPAVISQIASVMTQQNKLDPVAEVRAQNQEMMLQLHEIAQRQEELELLNQELSDTNRGVVALYAELEERADHLRRADQLKTRFLSNMSHEFRTPLNSILSLSRLLLARVDGPLGSEQEKQVKFIRAAAENLTELVNDLLDLARVEAGKTVVASKEFTVNDLFGALRGMLRPILVGEAVDLVFEDAQDVPPMVNDEGKISQILRNFISNAIKFTEKGEIRIWASYHPDDGTVTFQVRDTGIGIAEEDVAIIWEEFGQAPNRLQHKVKGTGLGLPLTRKLSALLGGSVEAESVPGEGSIFRLVVPLVLAGAREESSRIFQLEPGQIPILVVEDNPADAFSFERSLAASNYQVFTVPSILEGKRALSQFMPAAVVLDVVLEGEESWRLLIDLKQNEKTAHIPILVLSTSEEERKARSFGADEYLHKPVTAARIIEVMDTLTGRNSVTRVLLIDDEEVSRYLIRQLLPRGAFDLREATSGEEGLRAVAAERPDLILLDLNMPGANGFEILERLKGAGGVPPVPVIIVSSMVLAPSQRAKLQGATKILSKFDLTTESLVSVVRDALAAQPVP